MKTSRTLPFRIARLLLFPGLVLAAVTMLRADDNTELIKDAHHQLALALNLGGDTPSDADRTTDINAAIQDLKDTSFANGRAEYSKSIAIRDLKSALSQIGRGDPEHGAEKNIRDADSIVRDLES